MKWYFKNRTIQSLVSCTWATSLKPKHHQIILHKYHISTNIIMQLMYTQHQKKRLKKNLLTLFIIMTLYIIFSSLFSLIGFFRTKLDPLRNKFKTPKYLKLFIIWRVHLCITCLSLEFYKLQTSIPLCLA